MGQEDRAAVIAAEQRAVDYAYRCLEDTKRRLKGFSDNPAGASAKDNADQRREYLKRLESLEELGGAPLVIDRVDVDEEGEPETYYLGRRTVRDAKKNLVVLDWRSDAAVRWRTASQRTPGDVRLRRRLKCKQHRVTDFFDEVRTATAEQRGPTPEQETVPGPARDAAAIESDTGRQDRQTVDPFLLEELSRVRGGPMRDIVETIQRVQLELVADDRPGVLVIQGGPGTGKSAIGLHRVSWLLGNKRFSPGDILVIGPHRGFLDYVSQVLPALDSTGVTTALLTELWQREPTGTDTPGQRMIKSDLRMAEVLRRAVANCVRSHALDKLTRGGVFEAAVDGTRLTASRKQIDRFLERAREAEGALSTQRTRFLDALTDHLMHDAVRQRPAWNRDTRLRKRIQESAAVRGLVNAVWPQATEHGVLRRLLTDAEFLRAAAAQILTEEEQEALLRQRAQRTAEEPWTADDLVCLDELRHLLSGVFPQRYRHIVVDEAQDLTPMQVRSLARRCRTGSMTVLGDLAQSTGVHRYGDWDRIAQALSGDDGWHLTELTTGYRVPREVMDFAAPLAAELSPTTRFPSSIRPPESGALRVAAVPPERMLTGVEEHVQELLDADDRPRSVTVILHDEDDLLPQVEEWCASPRPEGDPHASKVRVLAASQVNGLEFDHVVVVEPAAIAGDAPAGLGRLYVALTRCTQSLTVLHTLPLPAQLADPSDPRAGEPAGGRRCGRYLLTGSRCANTTTEPDGWCRQEGCSGYRTSTPVDPPERLTRLPSPANTDHSAHLSVDTDSASRIGVATTALNRFLAQHRGTAPEFLQKGRHARQQDGLWLLDHKGYRLVLSAGADEVVDYRTVHRERSYAQVQAGVPSRGDRSRGDRAAAARRAALRKTPNPGMPLTDSTGVRAIDAQRLYITPTAHDRFDQLFTESRGLPDCEFDAMVRRHLAADLHTGDIRIEEGEHRIIGAHCVWHLSRDGRTVVALSPRNDSHSPGQPLGTTETEQPCAPEAPPAPTTTDTEPIVTTTSGAPPAEAGGLGPLLEAAVSSDREDNAHEAVRYKLLGQLFESECRKPHETGLADIVATAPAGSLLYEVLGEGGHTYAGMREGMLRAMEVRQAGDVHADYTFLVLPRPPAEPWAVEAISQMSGFSVIWRSGDGWDGQRIGVALGREA
ncbi:HelD family protein [Streptomonospora algeriensis]|uniref:HelD family protein n=1 Tax=Streptomonospora algeriensis TaxID=995084 RepID=A0ABW3B999_9ACTN